MKDQWSGITGDPKLRDTECSRNPARCEQLAPLPSLPSKVLFGGLQSAVSTVIADFCLGPGLGLFFSTGEPQPGHREAAEGRSHWLLFALTSTWMRTSQRTLNSGHRIFYLWHLEHFTKLMAVE